MVTDDELQKLAKEELLKDARCAAVRAQQFGAHRWAKPNVMTANKRFLKNMILSGRSEESRHLRKADDYDYDEFHSRRKSMKRRSSSESSSSPSHKDKRKRKYSEQTDSKSSASPKKTDSKQKTQPPKEKTRHANK